MAQTRNRRHILVKKPAFGESFTPYGKPIEPSLIPVPPDRKAHASKLRRELQSAEKEAAERRATAGLTVHGANPGLYVEFESVPGIDLKLESLEDKRQRIELVAVREGPSADDPQKTIEWATVFIPDGRAGHFLGRLQQYATEETAAGEARNADLVNRIAGIRLATLRALWTDSPETYPTKKEVIWWEVWLRKDKGNELERFTEFAGLSDIVIGDRRLGFEDRVVVLAYASSAQIAASIDVLNDVAELRRAKDLAGFFVDETASHMTEWLQDLAGRTTGPSGKAPAVCVLDTGVNPGHPLLSPALDPEDLHTCDPSWHITDHDGHGTEMAGLALYGNLAKVLPSSGSILLTHRLESVKILPPEGHSQTQPDLYGAVTADATSRVEVQAPHRARSFSMAISARDQRDRGRPTSWSSAIDALAAGRSFDAGTQGLVYLGDEDVRRRLFVIAAGNVWPESFHIDHLAVSDTDCIHDPGQAWNALTVGAYTELASLDAKTAAAGWLPVAGPADLSPWSTTSLAFEQDWPLKPDVVFEGGNTIKNTAGEIDFPAHDLSVLTTYYEPFQKPFVLSWATSAACAQAARLTGLIMAEYPELWPETVRALVVHAAEWTSAMRKHFDGAAGKKMRAQLVRRYGFGVPSTERALRSATNALTLIAQDTIRPFKQGNMGEMRVHSLPWPKEALEGLGSAPVRLRVTLSYFIEPNPSRRGWRKRYQYASHGLRFELKGPTETLTEFRKRINKRALDEGEKKLGTKGVDGNDWYLGQARNRGSLHSDVWTGSAAELAEIGHIGIFPVAGWWKENKNRDRSEQGARYALIMSIETQETAVDLWTPVATEVGVPVKQEVVVEW